MGNSSETPTPPSPPLFQRQWRKSTLTTLDVQTLIQDIKEFPPENQKNMIAKILLLGPAQSGKSSFAKTINAIFEKRITHMTSSGTARQSLTMTYRHFRITPKGEQDPLKFILCDTRGIDAMGLPDVSDLTYILEGNVPPGYQFSNTPINLNGQGFIQNPEFKDRVHCVAFVFEASSIKLIQEELWDKLNALQIRMNTIDMPRLVLLTKIDRLSEHVREDLSKVYLSKDVKRAVDFVSSKLRIPPGNVMPIKNYDDEIELDDDINCLALQALKKMLGYASDFWKHQTFY